MFATLGMFIVDEFAFADKSGNPISKNVPPQIGGGGTYAAIGARIWLPPTRVGMIIDRGTDFPQSIQATLDEFGSDMWHYRDHPGKTTRALNSYRGDFRDFEYLTPRIRLTPRDLQGTRLERPNYLHFICSPTRAFTIMDEVQQVSDWNPTVIYEPIPDRCVPEELDALVQVLPRINILSPNADEAFGLLSMPLPVSRSGIEAACQRFLAFSHPPAAVIIRSGAMGACVAVVGQPIRWVDAFWSESHPDKIVDVTGAGNSFLGGLAAGLLLENGNILRATYYASVSASFVIEQQGLPKLSEAGDWNGDSPQRRLEQLNTSKVVV
ncbi:PfkB domain-containing protein [Mycena indigotica]|uniref:PfkB domain-containing protein n=1 Tax=Mycena indigotica TaxID=2126181 RepID=A0A8H6SMM8_9AGAR|nr:PfkB domain-containing protein [Mycena indigotica]KAF7301436.1 PfkB domain-containing protein [Mycena indigotica]